MKKLCYSLTLLAALMTSSTAFAAEEVGGQLYISPNQNSHSVGESFDVQVLANTDAQAVNAIEGEIAYIPRDLSIEKVSIDKSILMSWSTPPAYDSASGLVTFSGWTDSKFTGKDGLIVTLTLRALRVGQTSLNFNSGSMLAADLQGSNIISSMKSAAITTLPKQIQVVPQPLPSPGTTTPSLEVPAGGGEVAPPYPSTTVPSPDAASVISAGYTLAPILVPFLALLVLIAFCIAYLLHRLSRSL